MLHNARRPVTVDDDTLRAYLQSADTATLLMTVAHLTADPSILPELGAGARPLQSPHCGLTPVQQAEVRSAALRVVARLGDESAAPPDPGLLRRITTWAMGMDTEEMLPLLAEELLFTGADPKAARWNMDAIAPGVEFRVAIIGAGMSGLLAAHRLSQAGVPWVIYEKNADVGGTWLENHYPGCRVDVPSHLYSYSFANRADWPDYFCTHDVVLAYFRDFAKERGLYEHIRFGTEVRAAGWDEKTSEWCLTLRSAEGETTTRCNALVSAVGQLNRPHLPDLPGRDSFAGPAFHSARWDHSVELTGKRVAVIGSGASACQFVPEIAGQAGEVLLFQRTPPWLRPTPHYHDPVPEGVRWLHENLPYYASWHRFALFAPGLHSVLDGWVVDPQYPPTERAVSAVNDELRASLTEAIKAQLADRPELEPHVIPRYPVGAKRPPRDGGTWIRTLKRDDVRLVTDAIKQITPTGAIGWDGTAHEFDVLIFGTGFHASQFLMPMRVTGKSGTDLHRMWDADDARAYLGMTVPNFPNMFCLYGPNTNIVGQGGSIFYFSECAVTYVVDALRLLLETGKRALEVREEVHDDYNARIDTANAQRVWGWSKVNTWYVNTKGRSAQNWPFTAVDYWRHTRHVDPGDYHLW